MRSSEHASSPRLEHPLFTKEMKKTYKILIPQMAPIHFAIMTEILRQNGYHAEVLTNNGPEVVQTGLKYVHNDTCYPALLVIGQMIDALNSGKYDLAHTGLLITQTGGGCRASNYLFLLRKALKKAGYGYIPVVSLNFSGLEKDSSLDLSLKTIRKTLGGLLYGDEIMLLSNQTRPYENNPGDTDRMIRYWIDRLSGQFESGHGYGKKELNQNFEEIASSFAGIPITRVPKVKVGIVGEIYIKYSPLGNNQLEQFLAEEGCEVRVPGLLGFVLYCIYNMIETIDLYGGNPAEKEACRFALRWFAVREKLMVAAVSRHPGFVPPPLFTSTVTCADGVISHGTKMGEGWLLTAEMMELEKYGIDNIICAQPFGCLPNHIVGKGMMNRVRSYFPDANIVAIDYDPSATRVNQENRIKLMLSVALERLSEKEPSPSGIPENGEVGDRYAVFSTADGTRPAGEDNDPKES